MRTGFSEGGSYHVRISNLRAAGVDLQHSRLGNELYKSIEINTGTEPSLHVRRGATGCSTAEAACTPSDIGARHLYVLHIARQSTGILVKQF